MASNSEITGSPFVQIAIVLALSFLMGLEREEHKLEPGSRIAAGVRTFPLIALLGYTLVVLSPGSIAPFTAGLLAVAAFLIVSYEHKRAEGTQGFTSEAAALMAYVMGALVARNEYWVAAVIAVVDVLLLSAKQSLRGVVERLDRGELVTFVKFLLLSAVILPIVPNRPFTAFEINPFRTWLVVVAVCGISYGSYLLQRAVRSNRSAVLSAILGGAYSSTVATVALAKQSRDKGQRWLYSGSIVLASCVMYLRLGVLVYLFNPALGARLVVPLLSLALLTGGVAAVMIALGRDTETGQVEGQAIGENPLELSTAFAFAGLFVLLTVATRLVAAHLGSAGVYGLAVVMGATDVDPFIMGVAQSAGVETTIETAAFAILIATAGNNVAKGIYASVFAERRVGVPALIALAAVGVLGLVALWLMGLA